MKFCIILLVILVPFEILSHYPKIDISNLLKENVQLIREKIFREKFISLMASTLFSRIFLNFWFLQLFVNVFMVINLLVVSY